jgi:hypothetical protein
MRPGANFAKALGFYAKRAVAKKLVDRATENLYFLDSSRAASHHFPMKRELKPSPT